MEPVITVGLDGSSESLAAARWAAVEAERRHLSLRLLHAWPMAAPEPARVPAEADQNYWARQTLINAREEIRADHPDLTVVCDLVADDARDALLRAASQSEMTVLGSRGLEPVESYFLGDISLPVVARAERPVVLVRAEAPESEERRVPAPGTTGAVVVALKLHGPCGELLEFAFSTAAAAGVSLWAVHGRGVPTRAYAPWDADQRVTEEVTRDARRRMSEVFRSWQEKFPQVDADESISVDSPAKVVVRAAEGAALLVLGRRRHRPVLSPRLGPVAQAAIHHARCPVAVVPHD